MKYFVVGHQSPDTDSVVSAIALSFYLKKTGITAEPIIIDKLNRETEFTLKKFKQEVPKLMKKAPVNGKFYLVDHGGKEQAITGLKDDNIVGVVDHHQMMGLSTNEPIFYHCEAVGSTSTILAKMFEGRGWDMGKKLASLLTAGIISDTLSLTSETTTKEDVVMLKKLSRLASVNAKDLSREMFEAKSDISGMNLKKILLSDFKEYGHKTKKLGIGVFETVDVGPLNEKKEAILKILRKTKKEKKLDLLFFGLVDIIKKRTFLYLISEKEAVTAQKAFNLPSAKEVASVVLLNNVVSRKKQITPFIFKSI